MFVKKKDGVSQRMATTKCFSCRTSGAPVQVSSITTGYSLNYSKFSNILANNIISGLSRPDPTLPIVRTGFTVAVTTMRLS